MFNLLLYFFFRICHHSCTFYTCFRFNHLVIDFINIKNPSLFITHDFIIINSFSLCIVYNIIYNINVIKTTSLSVYRDKYNTIGVTMTRRDNVLLCLLLHSKVSVNHFHFDFFRLFVRLFFRLFVLLHCMIHLNKSKKVFQFS